MQIAIRRGLRIVKKSPEIFLSLLFPLSPILSPPLFFSPSLSAQVSNFFKEI